MLAAAPLAAQQPGHACAMRSDPTARLACYDRAFPPPPEVREAARQQAEAGFGLEPAKVGQDGSEPVAGAKDADSMQARVERVDYHGGGLRVFVLGNGQSWIQTDSRGTGHVQPGDQVQVRKGLVGGYLLVMPNGVSLRVKRTR
jgi:hypothetical protein